MEVPGTGPIDLPGPLCRIRFQDGDGDRYELWAQRNGPVSARILEPMPEPAPQHYNDVVVFDPAALDPPPRDEDPDDADDEAVAQPGASDEEPPATFAAVAVVQPGGYRTFVIDGPHPGRAAWQELEARLAGIDCRVRINSDDDYQVSAGGAAVPGIYALISIPATTSLDDAHAALADATARHDFPLTWPGLAAAAGDEPAAAIHRARLQEYEASDEPSDDREPE
jgi:hypothetical protein